MNLHPSSLLFAFIASAVTRLVNARDGLDKENETAMDQMTPDFVCAWKFKFENAPSMDECDENIDCSKMANEEPGLCTGSRLNQKHIFRDINGACISPPFPENGMHDFLSMGAFVNNLEAITYSCQPGYELEGEEVSYCINGSWFPTAPTCKLIPNTIFCPGLKSRYLDIECFLASGEEYPCNQPALNGSVATYSCSKYYLPAVDSSNHRSECKNGTWSRELLKCKPVCGKVREEKVVQYITHGEPISNEEWPWQVVLYNRTKGNGKFYWEYQCGGSLISENIVLTAAHCIWKNEPQRLAIAIGKYYREFERQDWRNLIQIKMAKDFIFPKTYQHKDGDYESDLALIVLDSPVTLTSVAQPVCLDWSIHTVIIDLSPQNIGTVAGWGLTEDYILSHTMRKVDIPVVSSQLCIKELPPWFTKYVRSSTFCAGYRNGTGVCNGDSGSGLIFPRNGTWILQGIVSVSPRGKDIGFCDPKHYSIFTRVHNFIAWIIEELNKHGIQD